MRLTLRFVLPLTIVLTLIAYVIMPILDNLTLKWFSSDIDMRAELISNTTQDNISDLITLNESEKIKKLFNNMILDEKLYAISFCNFDGSIYFKSKNFPDSIHCTKDDYNEEIKNETMKIKDLSARIAYIPIKKSNVLLGHMYLIHDMNFARIRSSSAKTYAFYFFIILSSVIIIITVFIAQLSLNGWIKSLKSLLKGEKLFINTKKEVSSDFSYIRPLA